VEKREALKSWTILLAILAFGFSLLLWGWAVLAISLAALTYALQSGRSALGHIYGLVVRDRLTAGDSDEEVVQYLVARYGEFVLLRPTAEGANLILWLAAPGLLLLALGIGWQTVRRRPVTPDETLTDAEKAALDKILRP